MADRRRGGKKKPDETKQKLTKEEDAIARYVRFNCPTKTTMFEGNEVHYFSGVKAVDTLIESKKYGAEAKNPRFMNRASVVTFMRTLLEKGLFFRARKLVPKKREDKRTLKHEEKEKGKSDVSKSPKKQSKKEEQAEKEAERAKKDKRKKEKESDENEEEEEKEKKSKDKEEDEKKKRKVKLELHQVQAFNDANDVYVWVFDPTPLFKKIIGALMVLGTIAGCLFPLWPIWVRQGVYYLSLVGLACFGVLIGVAIARTILFAVIWVTTMGKHKLWLLPNLMEDCGFFESFKPLYTYEYCPGGVTSSGKKKKKSEEKKKWEEESLLEKASEESGDGKKEKKKAHDLDDQHSEEELGNGDHAEDVGDSGASEGSATEDDEEESSQATGTSVEGNEDEHGASTSEKEPEKVRQRRRARRADDDFVLVDGH